MPSWRFELNSNTSVIPRVICIARSVRFFIVTSLRAEARASCNNRTEGGKAIKRIGRGGGEGGKKRSERTRAMVGQRWKKEKKKKKEIGGNKTKIELE